MKKLLAILLALTMVLTLGACGSGSKKDKDDKKKDSYKTALENALEFKFNFDTSKTEELAPEAIWNYYSDTIGEEDIIGYINEEYESRKQSLEEYDEDYEYTVEAYEELEAEEVAELAEDVEYYYDGYISASDIDDKGYYAEVIVEYLCEGEVEDEEVYDIILIKIDGKWYAVCENGEFFIAY